MPYADRDKQREAQARWARQKRARQRAGASPNYQLPPLPNPGDPTITEHVADRCIGWLAEAVEEVRADDQLGSAERARTLATLTGSLLKAAEAADLETRLEALEAVWVNGAEAS